MSEWIPVEERLPETNEEPVRVVLHHRYTGKDWKGRALRDKHGAWRSLNSDSVNFFVHYHITHWQPLPEPPP